MLSVTLPFSGFEEVNSHMERSLWPETEGSFQTEPFTQGTEGSQQGTQTLSWQTTGTESCQLTCELENGPFTSGATDETPALADT